MDEHTPIDVPIRLEEWDRHDCINEVDTIVVDIRLGSVRPRLTRKACSPKTRLFDCAERSNKRVEISLLQRQIDDSVQMCKQAFF